MKEKRKKTNTCTNNTYDEGGWENRKKDNRQMKGVCDFVKLNYI